MACSCPTAGQSDRLCAYHAIGSLIDLRRAEVVETEWDSAPLFAHSDGSAWSSSDSAALAKAIACLSSHLDGGVDPSEAGGKSWRIAGATELRDQLGAATARALIKERGRWASDISDIYTRAPLTEHLDASAAAAGTSGREIEAASRGWVQPA